MADDDDVDMSIFLLAVGLVSHIPDTFDQVHTRDYVREAVTIG